jgi:hypothetical protein
VLLDDVSSETTFVILPLLLLLLSSSLYLYIHTSILTYSEIALLHML